MAREENWATYVSTENDTPILVQVDLALVDAAPLPEKPYLTYLTVDTRDKSSGLLTENSIQEIMNDLDECIAEEFAKSTEIIPVGITSQTGTYTYFFYADSSSGWGTRLESLLRPFVDFDWQCGTKKDPSWECYFEYLYPNIFEMQVIYDLDVLQQLSECGDDGTTPRPVSHWAIFSTAADCQDFCGNIKAKGYEIAEVNEDLNTQTPSQNEDEQLPEGAFEVHFKHTIQPINVSDHTLELVQSCIECQGEYDGWETEVLGSEEE